MTAWKSPVKTLALFSVVIGNMIGVDEGIILQRQTDVFHLYQHLVCMWITYFTFSKLLTLSILEKAYYKCTTWKDSCKIEWKLSGS